LYAAVLVSFLLATGKVARAQEDQDPKQQQLQELLESVPIPDAFHEKSDFYLNDEDTPSQQYENWVAKDWNVSLQSVFQPGLGFIPFSYTHGTESETWDYSFQRHTAERSEWFSKYARLGGNELTSSVYYLLRILKKGESTVSDISLDSVSHTTIVTFVQPNLYHKATLSFEQEHGWITQLQAYSPSGELVIDTHFNNWMDLDHAGSIPFLISTDMPGTEPLHMVSVVTEADVIDPTKPPERLPIASDFTIIDQIEGVTKTADGKVIGPIVRGKPAANANTVRTGPPGTTGLKPRLVMLIGVGLILLAGVILGLRRWKGA